MDKFSFRLVLLMLGFLSASVAGADRVVAQEQFSPITIFIIRHAEKADEPRQDPPLSEKGIRRAAELTRLLSASDIKAVYTSQFQRTKLTGELVANSQVLPPHRSFLNLILLIRGGSPMNQLTKVLQSFYSIRVKVCSLLGTLTRFRI